MWLSHKCFLKWKFLTSLKSNRRLKRVHEKELAGNKHRILVLFPQIGYKAGTELVSIASKVVHCPSLVNPMNRSWNPAQAILKTCLLSGVSSAQRKGQLSWWSQRHSCSAKFTGGVLCVFCLFKLSIKYGRCSIDKHVLL